MQNSISAQIQELKNNIPPGVTLIAVSKFKTVAQIREAYEAGQRDFGENRVQELAEKQPQLPSDIRWHLIGHLQRNKVKYISSFVHLIHSVDGESLLEEIQKQALKAGRNIPVLLQVHIAKEESKFGFDADELIRFLEERKHLSYSQAPVHGLMGMATNTEDQEQVRKEFRELKELFGRCKRSYFQENPDFNTLSMGMSSDYNIAVEEGSTMIRVGSAIFGNR